MSKIQILLSTYNGEQYLEELLRSLMAQEMDDFSILVRDDGSSDGTHAILDKWEKNGLLTWYRGSNIRPARSFLDLLQHAKDADYYAFCDQDDVWDTDKLSNALTYLKSGNNTIPALYFSQTQLVNEELKPIPTPKIKPRCSFYESLIVHHATGCTFVFNRALLQMVRKYEPEYISMHDLWIYCICLAIGGTVYFDPVPHIKYRQHSRNVIGLSGSRKKTLMLRWQRTFSKECERSRTVSELFTGYKDVIKQEYIPVINHIINYKHSLKDLLWLIFYNKLWCDDLRTNITMRIALLLHSY